MADKKLSFEQALADLEKIVAELETGSLSLNDSVDRFTEGINLIKYCNQELNKAETKIEMVLKEEDGMTRVVPFDEEEE